MSVNLDRYFVSGRYPEYAEVCGSCGQQGISETHTCGGTPALHELPQSGYKVSWMAQPPASKVPHKCPACDGWGKRVQLSGWVTAAERSTVGCPACGGAGVVWEP